MSKLHHSENEKKVTAGKIELSIYINKDIKHFVPGKRIKVL